MNILVIGELLGDLISKNYVHSLAEANSFEFFQGGSPANVAANLGWLSAEVTLVSCVGNDRIGDRIIKSVEKTGLRTTYISRSSDYPTTLVLVGQSRETPDFIAYRMADTQIGVIHESLLTSCQLVHSCAFALSKNPAQQNIINAFEKAVKLNKMISIDWNFSPKIWSENGQSIFKLICSMKPLLKISMDDLERFTGESLSVEQALSFLTPFHTTVTCFTHGKEGVWYKGATTDWTHQPAKKVSEVRDTTGAGDAFWAGFLYTFTKTENIDKAVAHGLTLAATKIQKVGPLYDSVLYSNEFYNEPPGT
jgi:sugar/nucleoside kinase (ribokinase family)